MRISDADRERVVEELGQHLVAGRLDLDEYSQRVEEVMGAETLADLDHARRDLPFLRVAPPRGALPAGAVAAGRVWQARVVVLLAAVLVAVGVLIVMAAQAAFIGILLVGWLLGVALGRASRARR